MKQPLRPLSIALSLLLAACATTPVPRNGQPPAGAEAPATRAPAVTNAPEQAAVSAAPDVWARLRDSFALPACAADPAVEAWAKRYTRSPRRFESQMRAVLPRLVYVEESAARHGVPGEFALLPWVESHFTPVPPRGNRPAGMWQIVPSTARRMKLQVGRAYDGRLDLTVSTDAVMTLLRHYHDWFQDWRLADYAYNGGRFGLDRLLARVGAPPPEPAVPELPVRAGTRQHLVKLLAIACVVREPERFGVTLPTLDDEQHLVAVAVGRRLTLAKAARQAGMPLATLANLNAGYRNGVVDASKGGGQLLLPRRYAEQLRAGLLAQAPGSRDGDAAGVGARSDPPGPNDADAPATRADPPTYVVRAGDTLSRIARRYHVRVAELKQWNHLRGDAIHAGQKLAVGAPD
ncbi:LysM peptidoglycan-binding domain-containing protein [Fulvimonas yonginensis]|uniref:LysM peptidoglycan-binding domain-containing protein n=1 Tax=Fulvimonas yonginensis TaxID=1495200 RepID=A0ABU8JG52_9GAMM